MNYLSNAELKRLEESHPELKSSCPTCQGTESYFWNGMVRECDCREQRRLYTQYAHAGIGLNYMRLSWADVDVPAEQLEPVNDYMAKVDAYINAGIGLYLPGTVGSGKTTVLNLILKDLVKRGMDCYSTTFVGAIDEFASSWRDNTEKRQFAERFECSRVLGLDDVGKEYSNKLSGHTMDRILRARDQEDRPTIITTNYSSSEIRSGYGGPVLSLLVGRSIEVPLTGEDFRIKARERKIREITLGETRPIS